MRRDMSIQGGGRAVRGNFADVNAMASGLYPPLPSRGVFELRNQVTCLDIEAVGAGNAFTRA
jgi:hypothetical protein